MKSKVTKAFAKIFGAEPAILVRAPGRVNLIGEHTDYNDGFVMPMAIDRHSWIALRPRDDDEVRICAIDYDEEASWNLDAIERGGPGWAEYAKGVAWSLMQDGLSLKGWEGVNACDVPMGAGLSSSAAFELVVARAFASVSGIDWDPVKMALAGQRAENGWVGVNCGIMDQMISATGQAGKAILIDCRSLSLRPVPLPVGYDVIVLDTATRRGLVESAYNERRAQCEEAARAFGVKALRDVTLTEFDEKAGELGELTRRRARHVISENERTLQAAEAMQQGDAEALGALMDASHVSLRDDFEVSNEALDVMVDIARSQAGCVGARMTGAGFGGCAMALVREADRDAFLEHVPVAYEKAVQRKPAIYVCKPANGAEEIN